jgi:hypothetical protein
MAEIVGAAIISAATAAEVGAAVGVSAAAVTSVVGAGTLLGLGVGVNLLSSALRDDAQKVATQQFASRQPVPARQRSYGRVKLAGAYVQYKSAGGAFFYAVYHGEGPWDAIEQWWLDDLVTNIPAGSLGGTVSTIPWRGFVAVESRLGAASQGVIAMLQQTPGWDANHHLNGCVYTAVKSAAPPEKKFKAYYPKTTWPSLRVVGRASKVRNPLDLTQSEDPASWTWNDRAGPCIRDFLTHRWGLRIPPSLISDAKFRTFSALCDETVTLKDGTTHPRYVLGGTYQLTDDPVDTLNAMLATCDGRLTLEADGTIGITGGRFPAPTVTLTDDDVLSLQIEAGGSKLAAFNRLKITYVDAAQDYQQVEAQPWDDVTAQQQAGELLEEDFSRPWVPFFEQARRLAKIAMGKGNPAFKITGVFKLSAAAALFEESVRFTSATYGIDMVFLVTRPMANLQQGTVTLDFASIDPAIYAFNNQTEEGTPPTLPNATAPSAPPGPPQDLTVAIERKAVSGGINATFLRLTATPPTDRSDLSLIGRYREVGASDFLDMAQDSDDPFSLISGVLVDGGQYEAQGAVSTYGRALVSDYLAAANSPILAVSDTTSTGAPTGFVVNGSVGQANYAFTAPNAANFAYARLYRSATTNFADAVAMRTFNGAPSQAFDGSDPRPAGAWTYWVRAFNASGFGDASSTAGPITVTVA